LRAYSEHLNLPEPVLPWHTRRLPIAELGAALAVAAGFCGKIALDLELLAQTEVAEVREPGGGHSSTMPHKRNPVGSVLVRACAEHVHAAAGVLLRVEHEHERAAGAWHAEWKALSDALAYTGGAAARLRETLDGLEVDVERMRANVRPETLSEAERFASDAREPEDYLGAANAFVDRALDFYRGT
jgi:3-carboxy-cis,cis-muconate cycloisomerase